MAILRPIAAPSRLRTMVHAGVFLLIAAGVVETWLIAGLAVPYRVVGGSMAEALLGVHRDVRCGDCGYAFSCDAETVPVAARAVCPNCGDAANNLESLPEADAQRVLIDRAAFSIRAPRRWEIAAFRRPVGDCPNFRVSENGTVPFGAAVEANKIFVKRIVGLPGESIEIRHGDVFVDGHIQRKNLAQQRALAILVYDANFVPTRTPVLPPRWRPDRWNATGGCFNHAAGDKGQIDWITYHHWRRTPGIEQYLESPVTDLCGYNQSQPRREEDVHAVTDLMLSFRLGPVSGRGAFYIRAADGSNGFETRLQFGDNASPVTCATACLQAAPCVASKGTVPFSLTRKLGQSPACKPTVAQCQIPASHAERLLEVSLIDQQFLLAIDGKTIVEWPYDRSEPPTPLSCPLAIGAEGIGVTVRDLRVYRDVYYTHPLGPPGHPQGGQPLRLAAGEYYVLGDNSSVSQDSRTWADHPAIDANSLIGKPLVAVPSVSFSSLGRWQFQVPNPLGIRYIR